MSTHDAANHKGPKESKYWHIRMNDMSNEQYNKIKSIEDVDYICIGPIEQNKVRAGFHYHCSIKFNRSRALSYVKKAALYNVNLSLNDYYMGTKYTTSTLKTFKDYVLKTGSPRYEAGQLDTKEGSASPSMGHTSEVIEKELSKEEKLLLKNKERLYRARMLDYDWFLENDFAYFNGSQCKSLFANCQHKSDLTNLDQLDNYYIYGGPGEGKTSLVNYLWPGHFAKIKSNEKWDSYSNYLPGHKTVYFDEMDSVEMLDTCVGGVEGLKTVTDVYPFDVRSNYGSSQVKIRPERFVVSSNYSLSQMLSTDNKYGRKIQHLEMVTKALMRRFKCMHISEAHRYFGLAFDKVKKRTVQHDWSQGPYEPAADLIAEFSVPNYQLKMSDDAFERMIDEVDGEHKEEEDAEVWVHPSIAALVFEE